MKYVIFVPDDGASRAEAMNECLEYAANEHPDWDAAGIIIGRWSDAIAMTRKGLAEVILVAERAHLPPDRVPRVVSVEEEVAGRPRERPSWGFLRPTSRRPRPPR